MSTYIKVGHGFEIGFKSDGFKRFMDLDMNTDFLNSKLD